LTEQAGFDALAEGCDAAIVDHEIDGDGGAAQFGMGGG
jgi:hypothetical protein